MIKICSKLVGVGRTPFVIAEMSGNHNQSLERALEIVDAAAKAGVHALKIQTYTADTMTLDLDEGEFFISDPNSLWQGKSLYKLYQEAYTPWQRLQNLMKQCESRVRQVAMTSFFSSAPAPIPLQQRTPTS